jgi:hypothetical protein
LNIQVSDGATSQTFVGFNADEIMKVIMTSRACCSNMVIIISQLLAGLVLFLSVVELGIVGAATTIVRQGFVVRLWAGAIICATFALNRIIVLPPIIFALCLVAISIIGGWSDVVFAISSRAVTSCPTESISGFLTSYGLERSEYYLPKTSVVPDRCYCWQAIPRLFSGNGRGCIEYDIYSGINCGAIVTANATVYSLLLVDAAITVTAIAMLIMSCVVACYRRKVVVAVNSDKGLNVRFHRALSIIVNALLVMFHNEQSAKVIPN